MIRLLPKLAPHHVDLFINPPLTTWPRYSCTSQTRRERWIDFDVTEWETLDMRLWNEALDRVRKRSRGRNRKAFTQWHSDMWCGLAARLVYEDLMGPKMFLPIFGVDVAKAFVPPCEIPGNPPMWSSRRLKAAKQDAKENPLRFDGPMLIE